ncbi:hypothetical protein [Lentzea cavernae]|uniref:hypothetical protein n=1 Tax=Lentzea cavernae TaxID=2020703 RepID=UPI0017487479|nr:hypothetical protein [Lentzea cavernae]
MSLLAGCVEEELFKALADSCRRCVHDELTGRGGRTLFEICTRRSLLAHVAV